VAQPQAADALLMLLLPLAPVPLLLLRWRQRRKQQQWLAVRVGRRKTYGWGASREKNEGVEPEEPGREGGRGE